MTRLAAITIRRLQALNLERVERWHGLHDWTPLEWAGAMCGEAGEASNFAKKLRRLEGRIANHDSRDSSPTAEKYRRQIAHEVADAVIYGVLLCGCIGEDLEDAIREAFNAKSLEYSFPERL